VRLNLLGLQDALTRWGADPMSGFAEIDETIVQTILLADLSRNVQPILTRRLHVRSFLAANGAGNFNGLSLSCANGVWIRSITNNSAVSPIGVGAAPDSAFFDSDVGFPGTTFNWIGVEPGEIRSSSDGSELKIRSKTSNTFPALPSGWTGTNGGFFELQQNTDPSDFWPLWIPAGGYLNVVTLTSNAIFDISVALQVPAILQPGTP
jgi:hypothetical protein